MHRSRCSTLMISHAPILLMLSAIGTYASAPVAHGLTLDSARQTSATTPSANGPTKHGAKPIRSKLNGEQVLLRLLELIRGGKSVKEFTPAYLSKVMGVGFVTYGRDHFGFGEQLTPDWSYGIEVQDILTEEGRPRLDFNFNSAPETYPPMTDICKVDFDRLTAELETMGFARHPYYAEHDRHINDDFDRSNMQIEVYPDGESDKLTGKPHLCVKMVVIR